MGNKKISFSLDAITWAAEMKTPCRLTDSGPQTPEDIRINKEPDEDYEYECWRQREMDKELEEGE